MASCLKQQQKRLGIEQLRLTNFRCYDSLTLNLDEELPPVVLTGHNGAGKTNILEAVSFKFALPVQLPAYIRLSFQYHPDLTHPGSELRRSYAISKELRRANP